MVEREKEGVKGKGRDGIYFLLEVRGASVKHSVADESEERSCQMCLTWKPQRFVEKAGALSHVCSPNKRAAIGKQAATSEQW